MAKKERDVKSEIIRSAVSEGVNSIMEHHPRFKGYQDYIVGHVDLDKVNGKFGEIYESLGNKRNLSGEDQAKYLHKKLADYVAGGEAFDDIGKKVILKGGLEEKAKSVWGWGARKQLKGEKRLDTIFNASRELYEIMKSGDHAERMPELAEPVAILEDMRFLDPAISILSGYGLIDEKDQSRIRGDLVKNVEENYQRLREGVESRTSGQAYQKAAAFILGIAGILVLFSSNNGITGSVIGGLSSSSGLIGGALFFMGIALFVFASRKGK